MELEEIVNKVCDVFRSMSWMNLEMRQSIVCTLEVSLLKDDYATLILFFQTFAKSFKREGLFNEIISQLEFKKLCAEVGLQCLESLQEG